MARLKDFEKAFLTLYQKRLHFLLEKTPSHFHSCPKEEIFRRARVVGSKILAFQELPRAMDYMRKLLRDPYFFEGTVVLAQRLSGARGRFERSWHAPSGGLWLAIAFYEDFLPEIKGWFPILIGVALAETVQHFGVPAKVKWVNDLWVSGRKLAGVLIEEEVLSGERWALVGVGLNVNNSLPEGLPAISLKEFLGRELSLPEVGAEFLAQLAKYYGLLRAMEARLAEGIELPFAAIFNHFSDTLGRKVRFGKDLTREKGGVGRVLGLDPRGSLVIKTLSGEKIVLSSGEIAYLD